MKTYRNSFNALFIMYMTLFLLGISSPSQAAINTAKEIDVSVDATLDRFMKEVTGADIFMKKSSGVLIFPKVYKAGFGIGGEYGEGALRVGGKTIDYYSTAAASIGFQFGAQAKSIILIFTKRKALEAFKKSDGWEAGVDGSVALIDMGMGDSLDTTNVKDPIVAFIFGQKGLMYNLTLEGSKFSHITPK
ncbi:MAG: lipid-binding SYLF domain-containing protein [Nitrospinales bacterium]